MTLKLTYADMKSITRSRTILPSARSAAVIWQETGKLLDLLPQKPVRLIGAGIHSLHGEMGRQMSFDDYLPALAAQRDQMIQDGLDRLTRHYGLDFRATLDRIFQGETLYRTIEYMRKHR